MPAPLRVLVPVVALLTLCVGAAHAQDTIRSVPDAVAIPDVALSALNNRVVVLTMRDGSHVSGTQLVFDAAHVVIAEAVTNRVLTLPRGDVIAVAVQATAQQPPPLIGGFPPVAPYTPPPLRLSPPIVPSKVRHIGLQFFQGPGNVMLDFEYKRVYGWVGLSIGYPIIYSGDNAQFFGASVGLGGTWRMGAQSNWRFDLTGVLIPTYWSGFSFGVGIAAGFHYTAPNGFTAGFKIPIIGVAPGCSNQFGDDPGTGACPRVHGGANLIGNYFLGAAMSTPIMSIGYRW